MIFTSHFSNDFALSSGRRLVSIARTTPAWAAERGAEPFPTLFPPADLLRAYRDGGVTPEEYEAAYRDEVLEKLDPAETAKELEGAALLCHEAPDDFCHRIVVRKWLADAGRLCLELAPSYRVAVVGSRAFSDAALFDAVMGRLMRSFAKERIELVSGGARGADAMAERFAAENSVPITVHAAEWETHGKRAGFLRNAEIWSEADFGVAFWDGASKGTAHSLELARRYGRPVVVCRYEAGPRYEVLNHEPLRRTLL